MGEEEEEEEERKGSNCRRQMQGNVGMVHEMEGGLFEKVIEIVIIHAVLNFVQVRFFRLPR